MDQSGQITYDDQVFAIDPDIQQMFYGTGDNSREPGEASGDAAP